MKDKAKKWISEIHISNILFIITIGGLCYEIGQQHHQNSETYTKLDSLEKEVSYLHDSVIELSQKIAYMSKEQDKYELKFYGEK